MTQGGAQTHNLASQWLSSSTLGYYASALGIVNSDQFKGSIQWGRGDKFPDPPPTNQQNNL